MQVNLDALAGRCAMAEVVTLRDAVKRRGPYSVWDFMTEEEQRAAAAALWKNADHETRVILDLALAKELKFRPQSVRKLPTERVVGRLLRMVDDLPENMLFQFLFHLHMTERRPLLAEYLDAVGLPHDDGVLNLSDDTEDPEPATAEKAARELIAAHGHEALVYLATLKVADAEFWEGLDPVLDAYGEDGEAL
jgi:hypothetical protein